MTPSPDDSANALVAEMQLYYARRAEWYDSSMGYDDPTVVGRLEPVVQALTDGSRFRVIKHFLSDDELRATFAPYSRRVDIRRFVDQRRILVSYSLG